ncbi:unnamed protein product [Spirodela intermedia]|uniref:PsbP C-terminal domain-containing protein n=1 Tax=Spirodela intermedia TaxID=51605 RepID=A0A7I8JA22_SPIIN|nr:unnamed protein product [Spirodela intermedia]CAA6666292.1 unnamed protein product [Spirodela intermedia]
MVALLSLSLSLSRIHAKSSTGWRRCRMSRGAFVVACASSTSGEREGYRRRDLMLSGLSSSAIIFFPHSEISAATDLDGDLKSAVFVDDINAYSFAYPVELSGKNVVFKWVESRKPERYSSAAPLSPDARQRIVSERVDMINNVVVSVSIGPPNSRFLTSPDKSSWRQKMLWTPFYLTSLRWYRVTTGQRLAESSVLDVHLSEVDGEKYWCYEYLVRKSATNPAQAANLYRHYVASTAERDGYLYSLSASTLSKQWESMGPLLEKTVASFRLLPPTDSYVPPYKDPWRFW